MFRKTLLFGIIFVFSCNLVYSEFPIGIYGVDNPEDIKIVKEAGFNCVQTYKSDPELIKSLALESEKQDIKLLVYPNKIIDSKYKKDAGNYPMLAWYLFDEPDICKVSRDKLDSFNKKSKKAFPNHKTAFVIGQGSTETSYYDMADILMVDWYPVPHLPLESFGENIALAKKELANVGLEDKPLWAVVQIFDWKEYKQYRSDNDRIGRFPTKNEIRFMSYDAIFNGATGLFYFVFTSNKIPLPKSKPNQWKEVVEVIQEISFVSEIWDKGKKIPDIVDVDKPLKARSFDYQGAKYIFIINPTSTSQNVPKAFFKSRFDVIYAPDTDLKKVISKGKGNFPQYHVFVFRYN